MQRLRRSERPEVATNVSVVRSIVPSWTCANQTSNLSLSIGRSPRSKPIELSEMNISWPFNFIVPEQRTRERSCPDRILFRSASLRSAWSTVYKAQRVSSCNASCGLSQLNACARRRALLLFGEATPDHSFNFASDVAMHPFVVAVFLRMAGPDPVQIDTKDHPPGRKTAEAQQTVGRCKRDAIVASDDSRQAVFGEETFKLCPHGVEAVVFIARTARMNRLRHRGPKRLASLSVGDPPPSLEVNRPQVVWSFDFDCRIQSPHSGTGS